MFAAHLSVDGEQSALRYGWPSRNSDTQSDLVWADNLFAARIDDARHTAISTCDGLTGVGAVRLDNAEELARDADFVSKLDSNLRVALAACSTRSCASFRRLIGEFAFVTWNSTSRELTAVRDPLGLFTLYYRAGSRDIFISDRLDAFPMRGIPNPEFVAQFVSSRGGHFDRTIWSGIRPVPPGTILRWKDGRFEFDVYWSMDALQPIGRIDPEEAAREFRELLEQSLLKRVDAGAQTWAHLSGGLDSSSVVSMAATLAEKGTGDTRLGGTITMTDPMGFFDERSFADTVVNRFALRNEQIADHWPWRADLDPLPLTDHPARDYPYYARDRLICHIIRDSGGTSLLTGEGPDVCLPFTTAHIADLAWNGRVGECARELYRWTVHSRDSLWRTAPRDLLTPLLAPNTALLAPQDTSRAEILSCFTKTFAARHDMRRRLRAPQIATMHRGRFYQAAVARMVSRFSTWLPSWIELPGIEVRHPFLYLPLVELSLRLPYYLRTDPFLQKPVLRAAMKGVLPEEIRKRTSKGGVMDPQLCRAFRSERSFLVRLLDAPVLADLGCIEPKELVAALDKCAVGHSKPGFVYSILSLETWLSAKTGRLPARDVKLSQKRKGGTSCKRDARKPSPPEWMTGRNVPARIPSHPSLIWGT